MVELADPFAGPVEIGGLGGDHQYGAHPVDGLDLDEIGGRPAAGRDQDHAQLVRHRRGIGIFDREEGEGFAGHGIDIEGGDEIGHVRGFAAGADIHQQVMRGVDEQQAARRQQRLGDGFQIVRRGEMHRDDMDAEAGIEADLAAVALQDRGHLGRLVERDDVVAAAARHHGGAGERQHILQQAEQIGLRDRAHGAEGDGARHLRIDGIIDLQRVAENAGDDLMHVGADEIQHHLVAAVDGDGRGGAGRRRRGRGDLIDHGMGERRGAAGGRRPDGRLLGIGDLRRGCGRLRHLPMLQRGVVHQPRGARARWMVGGGSA